MLILERNGKYFVYLKYSWHLIVCNSHMSNKILIWNLISTVQFCQADFFDQWGFTVGGATQSNCWWSLRYTWKLLSLVSVTCLTNFCLSAETRHHEFFLKIHCKSFCNTNRLHGTSPPLFSPGSFTKTVKSHPQFSRLLAAPQASTLAAERTVGVRVWPLMHNIPISVPSHTGRLQMRRGERQILFSQQDSGLLRIVKFC